MAEQRIQRKNAIEMLAQMQNHIQAIERGAVRVALGGWKLALALALVCQTSLLSAGEVAFPQFANPTNFPAGSFLSALVAADFNRDGKLDVAVARSGGLSLLLGQRNGALDSAANYAVTAYALATGDFNKDGKADLVAADLYTIRILSGDGAGNLTLVTNFSHYNVTPFAVAVADLNANGQADLAVGGNPIMVILGRDDGSFSTPTHYAIANYPSDIRVGDVNGDTRSDLIVSLGSYSSPNSNSFCILTNRGDGTFGVPRYYAIASKEDHDSLELGDFNGDGKLDVAVLNTNPSLSLSNSVTIWLNQGRADFTATIRHLLGFAPSDITSADFNGDGIIDLIVRGGDLLIPPGGGPVARVLVGSSDGAFILGPPINVPAQSGFGRPTFVQGDFSGDGTPDLVFTSPAANSVSVMLNKTPPILRMARMAGYHQVNWLATFGAGFSLEYTTNLAAPDSWQPFPYPPVLIGNQKAITDWGELEQKFYRLRKP